MLARADIAPHFCDDTRYYYMPGIGRLFRRKVVHCIDALPAGETVLDVGYGMGVAFLALARRFQHIIGVDIHDHPHAVAESFAGTGIHCTTQQGSIFDLPLEDNSVDAAVAISLHEHLPEDRQRRAFQQVHRALKPGGCYVVGVPGVHGLMTLAFRSVGWRIELDHICTHGKVLDTMKQVFDVDETDYWPFGLPKRFTGYVVARGWKRKDTASDTGEPS